MKIKGNTILITGGGSGIGRGLAEALQAKGNQVIIAGRRKAALEETAAANPGMKFLTLDIEDPAAITAFAAKVAAEFPALNVLMNNAGIMRPESVLGEQKLSDAEAMVTTNLLGPIRLTSALIEHLKQQPSATVINVTSGLAFIPLAITATYSATKAALHSYSLSQRYLLKDSSVRVLELAPPYVQTELMGPHQLSDPNAMPLGEFIAETMKVLGTDADEVLTERVGFLRDATGRGDSAFTTKFNDMFAGH
jgi:uncharacterized oxidoreductase